MALETGSSVPTGDAAILPIAAMTAARHLMHRVWSMPTAGNAAASAAHVGGMKNGFLETGEHRDYSIGYFAQSKALTEGRAHNEDSFILFDFPGTRIFLSAIGLRNCSARQISSGLAEKNPG